MNGDLKGITVNGESLENYLSEEKTEECSRELQSDIARMENVRKKQHTKTRMQSHYDTKPKTIREEKEMDAETSKTFGQIIDQDGIEKAILYLLINDYKVSGGVAC